MGRVVSVAAGVDESDLGVDAFDEGVGDTQIDRCDDFFEVDLQPFGQADERVDAAAFGRGDPAAQIVAGTAGWMVNAVDVAQLFVAGSSPADAAVGARDLVWRASNLPDCGPNRVRFGKESRSWHENTRNTSPSSVTR